MRALALSVLFLLAVAPTASAFDLSYQSGEIDEWPGKLLVGIQPAGAMGSFGGGNSTLWYRAGLDVAYQAVNLHKDIDLWVGAGFGYGYTPGWGSAGVMNPCSATDTTGQHFMCSGSGPGVSMFSSVSDLNLNAFAMVTFNTLVFPLIPYAKVGAGVDILFEDTGTVAGGGLRLGGGADYWLFKQLALGLDVNFQLGGANGIAGGGFLGFWNAALDVRFVL